MMFVGGGGRADNVNNNDASSHHSNGRSPHAGGELITYGDYHGPDPYGPLAHQADTIGAGYDNDKVVTIFSPRTSGTSVVVLDGGDISPHSPRPAVSDADSRVSTVWRVGGGAWALLILLLVCICVALRSIVVVGWHHLGSENLVGERDAEGLELVVRRARKGADGEYVAAGRGGERDALGRRIGGGMRGGMPGVGRAVKRGGRNGVGGLGGRDPKPIAPGDSGSAPRRKPIPEDEGVQDVIREDGSLREGANTIEPILSAQNEEDVRGAGGDVAAGGAAGALAAGGGGSAADSKDAHKNRAFFSADTAYQTRVRDAISHSFNGYALKSFGKDSSNPLNGAGSNWIGLGVAILDVLDTLWYADLMSEFSRSVEFVQKLEPGTNMGGSFFETSIRALGGLMGGYTLSKEQVLLDKAEALGVVLLQNAFGGGLGLLPSFSPTMIPTTWEKLQDSSNGRYSTHTSLADAGSEQLE